MSNNKVRKVHNKHFVRNRPLSGIHKDGFSEGLVVPFVTSLNLTTIMDKRVRFCAVS